MQNDNNNDLILVLGGTNFMGIPTIQKLTQEFPNSQIIVINRGKNYWNNQIYNDCPNLKYFYGDRKDHRQMGKAVSYLEEKEGISQFNKWRAVIDFSCFKWREMQNVVKALRNKTEIYIFISSDSVYNNFPFQGQPLKEENFSIEEAYRFLQGRKVPDKYGYVKEAMNSEQTKMLPDVIGPYDNTERFWCSLEWVKKSNKHPIELIQKDQKMPLSFVFSEDVAQAIVQAIKMRDVIPKASSYNLAFKENPTYQLFMSYIASAYEQLEGTKVPPLQFERTKDSISNGMYPSTNYTCINCELAEKQLAWNPSSLVKFRQDRKVHYKKVACFSKKFKEMKKQFESKIVN